MERTGLSSVTEGIGQGRITENLAPEILQTPSMIDDAVHVPDEESIVMVYHLLDKEGLFVGASSALNVAAAVRVAQDMGPGNTIVTIICDGAYRYQSRLFSKKWLESKDLYNCIPAHLRKYVTLP